MYCDLSVSLLIRHIHLRSLISDVSNDKKNQIVAVCKEIQTWEEVTAKV